MNGRKNNENWVIFLCFVIGYYCILSEKFILVFPSSYSLVNKWIILILWESFKFFSFVCKKSFKWFFFILILWISFKFVFFYFDSSKNHSNEFICIIFDIMILLLIFSQSHLTISYSHHFLSKQIIDSY
jgi:hypothetical protein